MVIYSKEWNGKKRTVGSQVNAWEATVATLPDLTLMESVTYVNEIDVRKIGVGQPVVITLDSDPSKKLTGRVTAVANVGEQRPNTDAKVFEVKVEVAQADTTLRPGMTTGNAIETAKIANAVYVPIEAVTADSGIAVVYKRNGTSVTKQEIETGTMSDDEVTVLRGLDADDRVLLSPPADREHMRMARLSGPSLKPIPSTGDSARSAVLQTGAATMMDSSAVKLPAPTAPAAALPGKKTSAASASGSTSKMPKSAKLP
jgi:HlyD family secretion protein